MKIDVDYILSLGFNKHYLPDNSGFYLVKNIKNKSIRGLVIIIDYNRTNLVAVWFSEPREISFDGIKKCIIKKQYSKELIETILTLF